MKVLNQLICIIRKELQICLRDSDVWLYSFVMPCLFWPVLILAASEYFIWQAGAEEHMVMRVAFSAEKSQGLEAVKGFLLKQKNVVEVREPVGIEALKSSAADVAIVPASKSDSFAIDVYVRSSQANYDAVNNRVRAFLKKLQEKNFAEAIKSSTLPKNFANVFTCNLSDLAPPSGVDMKGVSAPLGAIRMAFLMLIALSLTSVAYGVMAPAVTTFTDEREKNTITTTLLFPATRTAIVAGKLVSIACVGVFSGVTNFASASCAALAVVAQIGSVGKANLSEIMGISLGPLTIVYFFLLIVFYAVASAALVAALGSRTKDYTQAYNILSLPVIWCGAVPFLSLLPMVHLDELTSLIPFVNLSLLVKDLLTATPQPVAVVSTLAEMLVLICVCVYLVTSLLKSERIVCDTGMAPGGS